MREAIYNDLFNDFIKVYYDDGVLFILTIILFYNDVIQFLIDAT